jgi:alginate O-acetyltransferase complex protein AlgI
MFGFKFLENFNYPYVAKSIQEFWRRWHISLSNWFRDYLYIPLGGNQGGKSRTAANLLIVFLLCGLWHGASWNFIFWGLVYGFFLVAERGLFGRILRRCPQWIQHGYVLFVVVNAWVLFRVETLAGIGDYFVALYSTGNGISLSDLLIVKLDSLFITTFCTGILLSTPIYPILHKKIHSVFIQDHSFEALIISAKLLMLGTLFLLSIAELAAGSYNPFIYFRF